MNCFVYQVWSLILHDTFDKDFQIKKIDKEKILEAQYLIITHAFGIPQNKNTIDYFLNNIDSTKIFKTLDGDTVFGGGGIYPDYFIQPEFMSNSVSSFWVFGANFFNNSLILW